VTLPVYNIIDFGARGDGKTLDTPSINKAIEEAAARGGVTAKQALREVSRFEKENPEPYRFGILPSCGFFIRHVDGIQLENVEVRFMEKELRPAFYLDDVKNAEFLFVKAQKEESIPSIALRNVSNLILFCSPGFDDRKIETIENDKF